MVYWSEGQRGFYDPDIHTSLPEDCIQVTEEEYALLMQGVSEGKQVSLVGGTVSLKTPPISLEVPARKFRNRLRDKIDGFLRPAATYKDNFLTSEQREQLIYYSLLLARWPSQDGWPYIELPEMSDFCAEILNNPVWNTEYGIV